MKLSTWFFTGAMTVLLCSCASTTGVEVSSQTSAQYAPVPVTGVYIASRPPKGHYIVLADLKTTVQPGEKAGHVLKRLQDSAAALGGDYVLITSISDKTFLTAQDLDLDSGQNPYLATQRNFDSTANSNDNAAANYVKEVVTAQALKVTSGSHRPNKAAPSTLWK